MSFDDQGRFPEDIPDLGWASDERLRDLSEDIEISPHAAPLEVAVEFGGDDEGIGSDGLPVMVGGAVVVRLISDGSVTELVEASQRTDSRLSFPGPNQGLVWVKARRKKPIPAIRRMVELLMIALAAPLVLLLAMVAVGGDWLSVAAASVLGAMMSTIWVLRRMESASVADVVEKPWVWIDAGTWASILDHTRSLIVAGKPTSAIVDMVTGALYGQDGWGPA